MTRAPRLVLTLLALALLSACQSPALPSAQRMQSPVALSAQMLPLADASSADAGAILAEPTAAPPTAEPTAAPPTAEPLILPSIVPTAVPTAAELSIIPPTPEPALDPAALAAGRTPQRLIIESIGMDRALLAVGLKPGGIPVVPDYDAAWFEGSGRPGGGENVVLWGHALRFLSTPDLPAPMERMKEAAVGDIITLVTADGQAFRYMIQQQVWATPDQVGYILPQGRELLTIVNCIGDIVLVGGEVDMTHRLITIAVPVS